MEAFSFSGTVSLFAVDKLFSIWLLLLIGSLLSFLFSAVVLVTEDLLSLLALKKEPKAGVLDELKEEDPKLNLPGVLFPNEPYTRLVKNIIFSYKNRIR